MRDRTFPPGLILICGPTASGKSGLALQLAERLGSPILGADSRQVYREFNIGTAKPTLAERQRAVHYFVDICEPTTAFTVAEYQRLAQATVAQLHREGRVPLLVGGTGLYLRAVARGLKIPRVAPQPRLRQQLVGLGQRQGHAMLQQVDPASAKAIHPNDQVRTLRSLEVFYATGIPMSEQQGEQPPDYPILHIGLDSERLGQRIEQRTRQMLEMGLVAEVDRLRKAHGEALPLLKTLGYAEILLHLQGKISLNEAERRIVDHTRQFAKRQRTWFRADAAIEWFDTEQGDLQQQVWQRVQAFLTGPGSVL
ncbi:MAG: tRNA (adenosine(37)-N6)-dimethylallyltransferase MiaA [Cyanobacteria bacterium P01_A01_bin.135]